MEELLEIIKKYGMSPVNIASNKKIIDCSGKSKEEILFFIKSAVKSEGQFERMLLNGFEQISGTVIISDKERFKKRILGSKGSLGMPEWYLDLFELDVFQTYSKNNKMRLEYYWKVEDEFIIKKMMADGDYKRCCLKILFEPQMIKNIKNEIGDEIEVFLKAKVENKFGEEIQNELKKQVEDLYKQAEQSL